MLAKFQRRDSLRRVGERRQQLRQGACALTTLKINAVTRNDAESATRRTESAPSTLHSLLSTSISLAVSLHSTPSRQSNKKNVVQAKSDRDEGACAQRPGRCASLPVRAHICTTDAVARSGGQGPRIHQNGAPHLHFLRRGSMLNVDVW